MGGDSGGDDTGKAAGRGRLALAAVAYCALSSTMLVVNKAAVSAFPHPNTVLLLQMATTAALARAAGAAGAVHVDTLCASRALETLPLTVSFFLNLFTSMNALRHINVDTMVVLRTCTPIAVAVAEWLFLHTPLPSGRGWAALGAVVVLTAAALSMNVAAIPPAGAAWLAIWFAGVTFYMVFSQHYVRAVRLSTMGRVFYENVLSCALCLPLAAALELPRIAQAGAPPAAAAAGAVAASCVMGFAMSWSGWSLRQHVNALSYTVIGVLNKLATVAINALAWDRHGPPLSQALLVLGILAGTAYQQQQQHRWPEGGAPAKAGHAPAALLGGAAAAAAAMAALVWAGVSLGGLLTRLAG